VQWSAIESKAIWIPGKVWVWVWVYECPYVNELKVVNLDLIRIHFEVKRWKQFNKAAIECSSVRVTTRLVLISTQCPSMKQNGCETRSRTSLGSWLVLAVCGRKRKPGNIYGLQSAADEIVESIFPPHTFQLQLSLKRNQQQRQLPTETSKRMRERKREREREEDKVEGKR